MSTSIWVLSYSLDALFSYWVLKLRGAEYLEGTFKSGFLLHALAPTWSADGIRIFVVLKFFFATVWFVVGLIKPEARF